MPNNQSGKTTMRKARSRSPSPEVEVKPRDEVQRPSPISPANNVPTPGYITDSPRSPLPARYPRTHRAPLTPSRSPSQPLPGNWVIPRGAEPALRAGYAYATALYYPTHAREQAALVQRQTKQVEELHRFIALSSVRRHDSMRRRDEAEEPKTTALRSALTHERTKLGLMTGLCGLLLIIMMFWTGRESREAPFPEAVRWVVMRFAEFLRGGTEEAELEVDGQWTAGPEKGIYAGRQGANGGFAS